MKFLRNNKIENASSGNRYVVFENDNCKVKIFFLEGDDIRLQKTGEQNLAKPVQFGSYNKEKSLKIDSILFSLTGLESGKLFSYRIIKILPKGNKDTTIKITESNSRSYTFDSLKNEVTKNNSENNSNINLDIHDSPSDTLILFEFDVAVHEITHIEAGMGPIYSKIADNDYSFTPVPGDTSGGQNLVNKGTDYRTDFVIGAIIRPWGYDQNGKFSLRNRYLFFGLGVSNKQKVFENIYLGLGTGFRAFNIVIGLNLAKEKLLIDGYSENVKYKKDEIPEKDKIVVKKNKWSFFGGLLIDFSIFNEVFSTIF